jgi:cation diffusion facilitator CzcD-associated flavoprotein CzcO
MRMIVSDAIANFCTFAEEKMTPRWQNPAMTSPHASTPQSASEHEVVILGAGMSGLCAAIELKRSGQHDFVVLEKSAGLGGTWWDNRYPGAQVDVPSPLYCFSFEPNPRWQRRAAAAAEIQSYMQHCADKYGVHPHLRLHTRIVDARFDENRGRWLINSVCDGVNSFISARFFICSVGPLSEARWPEVPGLKSFQGRLLHSSRWDTQAPLAGQRVAVIGTGSTAAQLIPHVAAQAQQLFVFQRTANWVMPRPDRLYNALDRALMHLPLYGRLVRTAWLWILELGRRGFDNGTLARKSMLRAASVHLHRAVKDQTLRARLRPPYPLGCKRLIYSNDFYPALVRPNVELVTDRITRVTPTSIVTTRSDGSTEERAIDALICATGFDVQHALAATPISGLGGRLLSNVWADGPQAHLGLTVAGFPNLFLMLGPNTATGHTSTLLYIEPGVRWALRAMQEVHRRQQRWLDLKPAVMAASNAQLQARLQDSVWSQCNSWYRSDTGRVVALWPGFTREYVRAVRGQSFDDFVFA